MINYNSNVTSPVTPSGKGQFWGTQAGQNVLSSVFGFLGGLFGNKGSDNNGGATPNYNIIPNGTGQPQTDYGKYIVWGILGMVFLSILFMGFSFVMGRKKN